MQTGGFPRPSTGARLVWSPPLLLRSLDSELGRSDARRHRRTPPSHGVVRILCSIIGSRVAPSWIVRCNRESFYCSRHSSNCRSPKSRNPGSFCTGRDPLQSSSPPLLETSGPLVTGTDLPWSLDALQRHPWSRPLREAGCPRPPRFRSQVFSTSQRFPL